MTAHGHSPWRTAFELLVSRGERKAAETVNVKTITTGDMKGQHAVEVNGVVQDGESLQECADRVNVVYENVYRTHNGPGL